jgi:integrase
MLKLKERHGSPYWYLRGTVRGISVDESTGIAVSNSKAANEYKTTREKELLDESIHGVKAVATFSQAALSYLQHGGRQTYRLDDVIKHFGTTKLVKIGQGEIDDGAIAVFPTMQPTSRRVHFYAPVSAILKHAVDRKWCTAVKIKWPKNNDGVVRWLTKDEANRMIEASGWIRPILIFMFYTGARIGEVMGLQMQDIDLDRKHVQFIDTKNGTSRGVPLHPRVVEAMREYFAKYRHNGGDVFRREDGSPFEEQTEPCDRIKYQFKTACKHAGITNFRQHDTRHTWATWHYQANRDLGALQKLGGWKKIEMVMRYAHTNVDELSDTIDRL